ncbi:DUF4325 domain-containing protein [Flammeovirga yaeyamensis]|uniref:DUF4325 domain-containing protein n=1 Tax=Flammeovirga yaeyamensis TaxID=367791 RepID=A0AAX1NC43_9BACT|nr:STAS-like domain-containing protein [Flammeovirga yaeyamensis]MBB3696908.1 hypothetical protein [Flammeovirga yaeyamensis]NMF33572.1 STAS-like domain-containing protein [Flammeovirga yaeyamensis]QWG05159.1 DUF4325 domain-containing protein [Flammeovirga yaeyamensis]
MKNIINIAKEFSETPGARYITDGKFSGQEFYENILKPRFNNLKDNEILTIVLDGTAGYATSFLDEAFGRLSREYKSKIVLDKVRFISHEEPDLINEIECYINETNK